MSGKAWLYLAAGLVGAAFLAIVPLFVQGFAAPLRATGTEDVILLLPVLRWVHAHTGWNLATQVWWGYTLVLLAYVAIVVAFEWLCRRFLDPRDDAWTSLLWSLRTWRAGLRWWGALVVTSAIALGCYGNVPEPLVVVALVLPVVVCLALPFLAWNLDNLGGERPSSRWRARWPGGAALAAVIVVSLAGIAYGVIIDGAGVIRLAIDLVLWIPMLILGTVLLLAWLERARFRDGDTLLRIATRRGVLGPTVAYDLRWTLLIGLLASAALPFAMLQIFVVPQLYEYLGPDGYGPAWMAVMRAVRFVTQWWWVIELVLVVPLAWFVVVAPARLLVQVGAVREPQAANVPPPVG